MHDTELDEILDHWTQPTPSPNLRAGLRERFAAVQQLRGDGSAPVRSKLRVVARRVLLAAAAVVVGVFVFSTALALSQTPVTGRIPYTVESEYLRDEDGGVPEVAMTTTSYTAPDGDEVVLSRSVPDNQLANLVGRKLDVMVPVWQRMLTPFITSPQHLDAYRKQKAAGNWVAVVPGCLDANCLLLQHAGFRRGVGGMGTGACVQGKVVGVETILGHATTAVQTNTRPNRLTMWLAPDLGCFALRIDSEIARPDGSFRVWQTKRAIKITMNP